MKDDTPRPTDEPEIVPPRPPPGNADGLVRIWISVKTREDGNENAEWRGPIAIILSLLVLGAIAAVFLLILLGTFLILLPALAALIVLLVLTTFFGQRLQRPRKH